MNQSRLLLLLSSGGLPLNNSGKSGCQTATASYTMAAVVVSAANPSLFVGVAVLTALGTVTSVSSDVGGAFTLAVASANVGIARSEIWYLAAPAAGAHTITVNLSGAISSDAMWVSTANVDQTTPIDASGSATGTSGTPSASVTSVTANAYLLTHIASSNKTLTATSPAILLTAEVCTPGEGASAMQGPIGTPGATAMAWGAVGALDVWTQTIIAIKPFVPPVGFFVRWFYDLIGANRSV